jgi:hypothetical protein
MNTEVHTHKQSEDIEEEPTPEIDDDNCDGNGKSVMTINDNTRVYINVLMEDLVVRFLERLSRLVTQTCSSDESLNNYTKARKKAELKHIRFVFETLLYGELQREAFKFGQQAVDRYKVFEQESKAAKETASVPVEEPKVEEKEEPKKKAKKEKSKKDKEDKPEKSSKSKKAKK